MKIDINEYDKALIAAVEGKLDVKTAPEFEEIISTRVRDVDKSLILDLVKLEYISSAGLRVVLLAAKQLKAKGHDLFIAGLKGGVKDVFELSGFYSIFKIFETIEDALSTL